MEHRYGCVTQQSYSVIMERKGCRMSSKILYGTNRNDVRVNIFKDLEENTSNRLNRQIGVVDLGIEKLKCIYFDVHYGG